MGDLIPGEEERRKVIVKWSPVGGAEGYEVCVNCNINGDGKRQDKAGEGPLEANDTCGGKPCFVQKDVVKGKNVYHVRAMVGGSWSPWSSERKFLVDEVGST